MNQQPRSSSIFERRLAKYRSLPLLWLRTCGSSSSSSSEQERRRHPTSPVPLDKDTLLLSLGHIGECLRVRSFEWRRSPSDQFSDSKASERERERKKEECREVFVRAFLPFDFVFYAYIYINRKNKTHLFAFFSPEKSIILFTLCLPPCLRFQLLSSVVQNWWHIHRTRSNHVLERD